MSAALALVPLPLLTAWADTTKAPPRPHLQAQQPKEALPPPSPDPKQTNQPRAGAGSPQPGEQRADNGGTDNYPVVGSLENVTFGYAKPQLSIAERLNQLETAIYHQTFPNLSLSDRSQRLKDTLLGPTVDPDVRMAPPPTQAQFGAPRFQPQAFPPQNSMPTQTGNERSGIDPRLLETWNQPFFQTVVPREQLEHFALDLVNQERSQSGFAPLQWDDTSYKVARSQVDELCKRDTVSHLNKAGENPDVRYTKAGGNDALSESLATVTGQAALKLNRALVARMIEEMKTHQDDRDSLMSPDATHIAFSLGIAEPKDKAISCAEVITKHAIMHPIPDQLKIGDKIEVKGVLLQPYKFQKVTIAWEGAAPEAQAAPGSQPEVPQDEAMPYFPPLDYVAYASKAEHDREKLYAFLRTTGVIAAIAGGMFMPPVALAAPLIAMAPSGGEPKAVADVPVHGGIKVLGSTFTGNVPVSHQGKEGLYYLTIWAATSDLGRPVPVSRRTIMVTTTEPAQSLKSEMPKETKDTGKQAEKQARKEERKEARKQAVEDKKVDVDANEPVHAPASPGS